MPTANARMPSGSVILAGAALASADMRGLYLGRPVTRPAAGQRRSTAAANGKISSDGLKPHDDLMAQFPFLGLPNS
jgi:hypothetical protein